MAAHALVPSWLSDEGALLAWLPALVPAFLLAYHRGWKGASVAFAGGMAALALSQAELLLLDVAQPEWSTVGSIVAGFLAVTLGAGWVAELLHRERRRIEETPPDDLTGLARRAEVMVFFEEAWGRALRGETMAIVLFDLDDLKPVNDGPGLSAGDQVLQTFGRILASRTRQMDLSSRFGGDEFLTVLTGSNIEEATAFAEDVRLRFGAMDFPWGRMTLSAGVSAVEDGMGSPDVLLAAADRALFAAKSHGGNIVARADEPLSVPPARHPPLPPEPAAPQGLEGLRTLVVDDDPGALRAAARLLDRLGCAVTPADSPREALRILTDAAPIDLLVTDIVMPEMSGFTLVDVATRVRPTLPVLYMSGYPHEEVYWGGTPGARSAFLSKPLELDQLEISVLSLIGLTPDGAGPGTSKATPEVLKGSILVVDDEPAVVRSLQKLFRASGYAEPFGLTDPRQLPKLMAEHRVDLLILDLNMPDMDGFEVLRKLPELLPAEEYLPVLVLTGDDDPATRRMALAAGAMDFLSKPFDPAEAQARVGNLLNTRFLTQRVAEQRDHLEVRVLERTSELADTRSELLHRLARAAEYRDDVTGRHAERVGLLASQIAAELGMAPGEVDLIRRTAPLHDVGKIGVPDAVLRKPGSLTPSEYQLMKTHTVIGSQILGGSRHRILQVAAEIAESHHERWDGNGYPHGLKGDDIPLSARIVCVADTFDTIVHMRPYKEALPIEEAIAEVARCAGTQFDPTVVEAFHAIVRRVGISQIHSLADPIDPLRDTIASRNVLANC